MHRLARVSAHTMTRVSPHRPPPSKQVSKIMSVTDSTAGYGIISRLLHWVMAAGIVGLFGLGWWMVGLDYYSPYYKSAPDLHRSIGIVMLALLAVRIAWRLVNVRPDDSDLTPLERKAARAVHHAFYPLLLILMASGYLISTADGRAIDVFGLFEVPALIVSKGLEDPAGLVHEWVAYLVMLLTAVHAAAAIKHHVVDKTDVLARMVRGPSRLPHVTSRQQ